MRLLLSLIAAAALSGCGLLYKVDVPQGNLLDQRAVADLQVGMSKRQVSLLLGTPAITSPFHQNRWDYVYSLSRRGREAEVRNLTLHFDGESLARIEGAPMPERTIEEELLDDIREYQRFGPQVDDAG
ncbi:MAG: outer membrane protein assembly factor BamE [Pseudoxanthomonas sp.]|nr:outer membrane protein assembly factor BamE [Pseudoxanthomonas sp.]